MSNYHALLTQLETVVKGDNVTTAQVEKLITELKVSNPFLFVCISFKIWSNTIDITHETLNKNSELLIALSNNLYKAS